MVYPKTLPPKLPGQELDYKQTYRYVAEWSRLRLAQIPYYALLTRVEQTDELHLEEIDAGLSYGCSHIETSAPTGNNYTYLRMLVEPVVENQDLTKRGTEFKEEYKVYVSLPSLVEAGFATVHEDTWYVDQLHIKLGDRFHYNRLHEVVNVLRASPWGIHKYNMFWWELKFTIVSPDANAGGYDFNPPGVEDGM